MMDRLANLSQHSIIFFDGDCSFCNKSVQFIIKRDRREYFHFSSLQSSVAKALLANHLHASQLDSIVLIEDEQVFIESTAVLRICKRLDGLWKGLYIFILVPKPIRDMFYRIFAKHRYRFFRKQNACMLPTPEIRKRFLNIDQQKK